MAALLSLSCFGIDCGERVRNAVVLFGVQALVLVVFLLFCNFVCLETQSRVLITSLSVFVVDNS